MNDNGQGAARLPGASLYALYVAGLAAALLGNLALRMGARGGWLPDGAQLGIAILSIAPLAVAAVRFGKLLRDGLDEMLQRVVLEGMAFALVVSVPLAALYVNLHAARVPLFHADVPELVMTPALLAAIGIAVSARRYR